MHRLVLTILAIFLLASRASATDISASSAQLAELLRQPIMLVVEVGPRATGCINKRAVENRGKAVMKRYNVARLEAFDVNISTTIYVVVNSSEIPLVSGGKAGCAAAFLGELVTHEPFSG